MFDVLTRSFSSVFSSLRGTPILTQKAVDDAMVMVKEALTESDVPFDVATAFITHIKEEVVGKQLIGGLSPAEQLTNLTYNKIKEFLGDTPTFSPQLPATIMLMGLQGSGKTTTAARLGYALKHQALKNGNTLKILTASVDFNRPAAREQLNILATKAGIDYYETRATNALEAAKEIATHARTHTYDLLILDTAGRMHIDTSLINEITAINTALKPTYPILVIDAMTGQESLAVAQTFNEAVPFHGAIVTKMDSQTRAGVTFAFRYQLNKPILFMGTGEHIQDLTPFSADRIARGLLDLGDLAGLAEKAEAKISKDKQQHFAQSLTKGTLSFEDFIEQLSMITSFGSIASLMKFIPGMGSLAIGKDDLAKGEAEIKKFKAIANSMTTKERQHIALLDGSRKKRIARGAGVTVADINAMKDKFEQTKQFVKLFRTLGPQIMTPK